MTQVKLSSNRKPNYAQRAMILHRNMRSVFIIHPRLFESHPVKPGRPGKFFLAWLSRKKLLTNLDSQLGG
jgi:hypothetical protein